MKYMMFTDLIQITSIYAP